MGWFSNIFKRAPKRAKKTRRKYSTTFHLSPNCSGLIKPKYIILHHSDGSFEGTKDWILKKESKVSYHYLIDSDGSRIQFVPNDKKAWHAGKSSWKPSGSSRVDRNLNSMSIGIAFYGNTYDRTPCEDEIDSVAGLCETLQKQFDIPKENVLTHGMVAPRRKDDCSPHVYELVMERI